MFTLKKIKTHCGTCVMYFLTMKEIETANTILSSDIWKNEVDGETIIVDKMATVSPKAPRQAKIAYAIYLDGRRIKFVLADVMKAK